MGRAFELMTNSHAAQEHFIQALKLIESCCKYEIWMEQAHQRGEFAVGAKTVS